MENINLDKIFKPEDLDYNMILSVPEEIGLLIQKIIDGKATNEEKNKTNIEIIQSLNDNLTTEESRKLVFKMNNEILPATIIDLPCIIEANKTTDYKNFYKSGDIAQTIYVHDAKFKLKKEDEIDRFDPFAARDDEFLGMLFKKDLDNKYKAKSGIAKCTDNIRSKRWKPKHKYNPDEMLDVSTKLKSIIDHGAGGIDGSSRPKSFDERSRALESQSNLSFTKPDDIKSRSKPRKHCIISLAPKQDVFQKPQPVIMNNTINIPIPKVDESEDLYNKYRRLKDEYNTLKEILEKNPLDKEAKHKKKQIKKEIKEIKETIK